MKTYKVLAIVVAFIAIFFTGCATSSYEGGGRTVRYQTQNQPSTQPLSIYGNQPKLSQVSRSGLKTMMLSQALNTNEVWNEYKSCARRMALPDNTFVLVDPKTGWVWKADCGNRLLPVEAQQVVVHRPAPVQTVVVQYAPQVQYVHRQAPPQVVYVDAPEQRICVPRRRCDRGPQYIGSQPIGGWGSLGGGLVGWATHQVWDGLNSSYYHRGGGQVLFGSFRGYGGSFSGTSSRNRVYNNNLSKNNIRIRF